MRTETLAEGVTLYQGDCREVLPTLGKVDAVVTDPPYGIGFSYIGYEDTRENLLKLIEAITPAIKNATRAVITPGISNFNAYPSPKWVAAWTWETTGTFGALGYNQWQPILFYGEEIAGFGNINGVTKSDRIHFKGGSASISRDTDGDGHVCPKPYELMKRLTLRFTNERETILDPFMGSGTTGVAAVKLGRKFIGIEIEPKYFDIACRRISEALKQPDMFIERPAPVRQESLAV